MSFLRRLVNAVPIAALVLLGVVVFNATVDATNAQRNAAAPGGTKLVEQGRQIFRDDTFGDEAFWGATLQLHKAIAGAKLGGVGPGVSPKTALAVGLKVDAARVPADVAKGIKSG